MRPHSRLILPLLLAALALGGGVPPGTAADATPVPAIAVEVDGRFPIDGEPGAIAVAADGVWVTTGTRSVVRLDPEGGEVELAVELPGNADALAIGERALWVSSADGGGMQEVTPPPGAGVDSESWVAMAAVHRIDLATGELVATIPVGAHGGGLAVGHGAVWVETDEWEEDAPGALVRIDPATNAVAATIPIARPGQRVTAVATGPDGVWAIAPSEHFPGMSHLVLVDPGTNDIVRSVDLGRLVPDGLIAVPGVAWITSTDLSSTPVGTTLSRVDAATGDVRTIPTSGLSYGIAASGDRLWLADCLGATVTPHDPVTGEAVGEPVLVGEPAPDGFDPSTDRRDLLSCPGTPVTQGNAVWVPVGGDGVVVRLAVRS